jgi:hypothetical protein
MFYELHPQLWGKGIMSEAFTEVLRFAMEEVGVDVMVVSDIYHLACLAVLPPASSSWVKTNGCCVLCHDEIAELRPRPIPRRKTMPPSDSA